MIFLDQNCCLPNFALYYSILLPYIFNIFNILYFLLLVLIKCFREIRRLRINWSYIIIHDRLWVIAIFWTNRFKNQFWFITFLIDNRLWIWKVFNVKFWSNCSIKYFFQFELSISNMIIYLFLFILTPLATQLRFSFNFVWIVSFLLDL